MCIRDRYHLDQEINDRGIQLDIVLVEQAIDIDERSREELSAKMRQLTALENPNSVQPVSYTHLRGFSPGALTSTKPHFPSGNRIRRSGTPEKPGDTNFGAIPPLALTA